MGNQESTNLSKSLHSNLKIIKEKLNNTSDLVIRQIKIVGNNIHDAALVFIDGITNTEFIQNCIINPLLDINKMTDAINENFIEDLAFHHFFVLAKWKLVLH